MEGDEVRFFKEEKELCNEHGMTFVMESIEDMGALREEEEGWREEELEGSREGKEQDGRERERNESERRKREREREWKKRDTQLGG